MPSTPLPPAPTQYRVPAISVDAQKSPRTTSDDASAFDVLLDALNPLQQIPGASQIYQARTGDKSSAGAQLAGHIGFGAAIAGPMGAAAGVGLFVVENILPGLFRSIGRLLGSDGHKQAQAPDIALPDLSRKTTYPAYRGAKGAVPELSAAQFDLLMQSISVPGNVQGSVSGNVSGERAKTSRAAAKAPAKTYWPDPGAGLTPADFVARMQANLDQLSRRSAGRK